MQKQLEFPFMEEIKACLSEEEELETQVSEEFRMLMNKYSVSEEDIKRVQLCAKFI